MTARRLRTWGVTADLKKEVMDMVAQEDSWVSVGGMNRLVRLPMCMQPLHGHTAWELSDLDHSHAATPQRVTRASCAQLLRSVLLLGAACR